MNNNPKRQHDYLLLNGTIRAEESICHAPCKGPRKASLSVIRGTADLGELLYIEQRVIIGRDPQCDLPLQDHRVSRQHLSITPLSDDSYLVQDLGSTNGTRVNGELVSTPLLLSDGDKLSLGNTVIRFALADNIDIDYQNQVSMLVNTDPLTGLPSKHRFDESLRFALQAAERAESSLSLLMMDMDGLKKINDTHGHLYGAHSIGCAGKLIANTVRERGQACRFGGDEFSAFLPNLDLQNAMDVAEEIRSTIANAGMSLEGISLAPTISIGIACFPKSGSSIQELTHAADLALYRAKANGKNCVSA